MEQYISFLALLTISDQGCDFIRKVREMKMKWNVVPGFSNEMKWNEIYLTFHHFFTKFVKWKINEIILHRGSSNEVKWSEIHEINEIHKM